MNTKLAGLLTDHTLLIVLPQPVGPVQIPRDHINFNAIYDAFLEGDISKIEDLRDPVTSITNYYGGKVLIKTVTGEVTYDGEPLDSALTNRIIQMVRDKLDPAPLLNFIHKVTKNVSMRNTDTLFSFIDKHLFAITPSGNFLAYKRVREDYTDCHTGTFDNSPGKTVSMRRNRVDDDPDRTCAAGLHVCGFDYLAHFGGARTVLVEVDPKNVVSIPKDYNHAKMRVCEYHVLEDVTGEDELSDFIYDDDDF